MHVHIITVSDRASLGEYEDQSGPRIRVWLEKYAADRNVPIAISAEVLPDDADTLRAALLAACERRVNGIITTGGTGVGPRDITPDVVTSLADKTIPGIMEHIRLKCGAQNSLALLSRSIAAVRAQTVMYTLPGNPKAIDDYMPEILKTIHHVVALVQGEQVH